MEKQTHERCPKCHQPVKMTVVRPGGYEYRLFGSHLKPGTNRTCDQSGQTFLGKGGARK